jgi:putative spermidine/putrescine transport system substrate-binding protein
VLTQAYGFPKGTPKAELALKFIDYSLSPEVQARWLSELRGSPVNTKAYGAAAPELIGPATKTPWTSSKGISNGNCWWAENRGKVNAAWSSWVL